MLELIVIKLYILLELNLKKVCVRILGFITKIKKMYVPNKIKKKFKLLMLKKRFELLFKL